MNARMDVIKNNLTQSLKTNSSTYSHKRWQAKQILLK